MCWWVGGLFPKTRADPCFGILWCYFVCDCSGVALGAFIPLSPVHKTLVLLILDSGPRIHFSRILVKYLQLYHVYSFFFLLRKMQRFNCSILNTTSQCSAQALYETWISQLALPWFLLGLISAFILIFLRGWLREFWS